VGEIKQQGIANTIITFIGIGVGFISVVVIQPNFLTPEELGLTRILFSFSALLAAFWPLGINSVTVKFFPYFKNTTTRHEGYFGYMLLTACTGFLLLCSLLLLFKPFIISQYREQSALFTEYFYLIFPFTFFLGLNSVLNFYSFALYKTSFPSLLNDILIRIGSIVIVTAYFIKWLSFHEFISLFTGIYGVQTLIMTGYILIIDKPGFWISFSKLSKAGIARMLYFGIIMAVASISSLGLRYIDAIFIGKYLSLSMVAIYAVAAMIPTIIEAPLVAIEKITSPKIASAWAQNHTEEIKKIYSESSFYLLMIGGLLLIGVNINIEDLLRIIPRDYSQGIHVVHLLSLSSIFNMATGVNNSVIFNSKYYGWGVGFLYILIILTVITNILLIPRYGLLGAALATTISSVIYNTLKFCFIWKRLNMNPFNYRILLLFAIIILVLIAGFAVPRTGTGLIDIVIRSMIAASLYLGMIYYFRIAPELIVQAIDNMKTILKKNK
jgi:O-antigen/teichoic acid export membrane protein